MDNFSPNMLKTFKECPQKYYFKYVQRISVPQTLTPFEKGKKVHALANYYLRGDDISKLEKALTPDEARAWDLLKNNEFFQKTYVSSEYNLSCKIGDFWFGGRIDAIVKDNNNYYILDYKTGSLPVEPENDYQTMIYLLAVAKFFQIHDCLNFIYIDLKNNLNYKIEFTKERESQYTDELLRICTLINSTQVFHKNTKRCQYCEYNKFC